MSIWKAKARKDYPCDVCGKVIKKGSIRQVEGYRCPAYTMIDKNICLDCVAKKGAKSNVNNTLENRPAKILHP